MNQSVLGCSVCNVEQRRAQHQIFFLQTWLTENSGKFFRQLLYLAARDVYVDCELKEKRAELIGGQQNEVIVVSDSDADSIRGLDNDIITISSADEDGKEYQKVKM